jgi:hypothetical protein
LKIDDDHPVNNAGHISEEPEPESKDIEQNTQNEPKQIEDQMQVDK